MEGFFVQSTAISLNGKWSFGSNALSDSAVISPAREKTKKQMVQVAHSIRKSCSLEFFSPYLLYL